MNRKQALKTCSVALFTLAQLSSPVFAAAVTTQPVLVKAGASGTAGAEAYRNISTMSALSPSQKLALLRQNVKYVFVIFQENRSFEHYFGTYPGANGLFDTQGNLITTPDSGTTQAIQKVDGAFGTISPFLIPQSVTNTAGNTVPIYPEDTASVDHSHTEIVCGAHFVGANLEFSSGTISSSTKPRVAQNDGYALDQEGLCYPNTSSDPTTAVSKSTGLPPTANPTLSAVQMGELDLGHLDCDTIPFLWNFADRFTLFDNFHQTTIGPSTPNAIAMIAGQSGETQWALHPSEGVAGTVPVVSDNAPFWGSNLDTSPVKPAWGPDENPNTANGNLTFATLPLSFMGDKIAQIIESDQNPAADLLDVQDDIRTIVSRDTNVNWGWYQQGFDAEPFDGSDLVGGGSQSGSCGNPTAAGWISGCNWPLHGSYIVHHNGPQYFGYLGNNTAELTNLHGLQDFYNDIQNHALPATGGVFYIRGGYGNNDNLAPLVPNTTEQALFVGNDDHPGYSDAFISEAQVADTVNAIASSPYWPNSAIIITYDETDGLYDHTGMSVRSWDPNGLPLTGGPRITAIVISPFSAAHTISHQYSEHSSVIKFIDKLFGLVPLANLPDEVKGRRLGLTQSATLNQPNLGPADAKVEPMGDLIEAFDNDRLLGNAPPLSASYAMTANPDALPPYNRQGCQALNITPTDFPNGLNAPPTDPAPADFNPRPATAPGTPTVPSWTP
jgi:phospholipase C